MPLELSRLHSLRCGPYLTSVPVGDIPEIVANSLATDFRSVNLSRESYEKIVRRHSDLSDFDFLNLPFILRHGLWIAERNEPQCRVALSPVPGSEQRYKAVIKRATRGPELWLTAFHRTKPRATRAIMKRGTVIKFYSE